MRNRSCGQSRNAIHTLFKKSIDLRFTPCVWRQFAHQKFLKQIGDPGTANADERIFKRQARSMATARRVVKIRNAGSGEAPRDSGDIGLPVPVVTLADNRVGQRVKNS
jgi:hypothetical protein